MSDRNMSEALYGVCCDVMSCKYHGHDDRCFADNIKVESTSAQKKTETFCGTYSQRPTGM